jgi:DNA helicase II / ATP-dependent DNA helicase PcrA
MIVLSDEQQAAVDEPGNVFVQACPGSGKTRVLTCRVIKGLEDLTSSKHRVVALTFTNRAADEIQSRVDQLSIVQDRLWAGTIHAFALEWILRPYAGYVPRIRRGFSIADEYFTERTLDELRRQFGKPFHFRINTARDRVGNVTNPNEDAAAIFGIYQERLSERKFLDYDDVLYSAYRLLVDIPEIARTLANIIRLICVDEIQDTQDLQFGILSAIFSALPDPRPTLFLVGDHDQCIYESLGAVTKSVAEISDEFGGVAIVPLPLTGNYRSTQRIIDFYQLLRPANPRIESLTRYAAEPGLITFHNQTIEREQLPEFIADLIMQSVDRGVPPSEICVLAPHWVHIRALSRSLVGLLPNVDFDAPGSSPLHSQRENFWFKVARLFLTTPMPSIYRTRLRWAGEVLRDLSETYGVNISAAVQTSRQLLRLVNSITSRRADGLEYLDEAFGALSTALELDLGLNEQLSEARDMFFEKARSRIENDGTPTDVESFKKLFKHPSGVVISTCHGVKGEEYETVIAFGLLRGYIPNWEGIIEGAPGVAADRASKLLYVICSRAKMSLHLIAESGRLTRTQRPYETTDHLNALNFPYD